MPRPGWKSITVATEIYDYFWNEYEKHREEYRLKYGITSFSGFTTKLLAEKVEDHEKKRKVTSREKSP